MAFDWRARSSSHFPSKVMVYFITKLFSFEPSKTSSQFLALPLAAKSTEEFHVSDSIRGCHHGYTSASLSLPEMQL